MNEPVSVEDTNIEIRRQAALREFEQSVQKALLYPEQARAVIIGHLAELERLFGVTESSLPNIRFFIRSAWHDMVDHPQNGDQHALRTAMVMAYICKKMQEQGIQDVPNPTAAFFTGLLHDYGKHLSNTNGLSHGEAMAHVMKRVGFPVEMLEAVRLHSMTNYRIRAETETKPSTLAVLLMVTDTFVSRTLTNSGPKQLFRSAEGLIERLYQKGQFVDSELIQKVQQMAWYFGEIAGLPLGTRLNSGLGGGESLGRYEEEYWPRASREKRRNR